VVLASLGMWLRGACALFAAFVLIACSEPSKTSERRAVSHVERLAKLADEDVEELRRGMPPGGKNLGQIWEGKGDPHADPGAVRRALDRVRSEERDLEIAKGTFFAVTDEKGIVLRSDQAPDQLAGKSLLASFPAIEKVLAGEVLEMRGTMAELAGARTGGDEQWVIAAPVRDAKAIVRGAYVSGWSFRRFAYHLEETLKHDLVAEALRAGESRTKQPLVYVFVFAGPKVYGAPVTPLLNSQTLEALDLVGKTDKGIAFHQQLEITGRGYGLAAARTPKMGRDVGVAVLRSEI
jgi:hypothetical protein